jgi:hypothetical protein
MVVALQRPSDLDTTYMLALLQEEMADSQVKSEFHGHSHGAGFKTADRVAGFQAKPPQGAVPVEDKTLVGKLCQQMKISSLSCGHTGEPVVSVIYVLKSGFAVTSVLLQSICKLCRKCGICFSWRHFLSYLMKTRSLQWNQ